MRAELRGIDEIADHDAIIFRNRPNDKALMSFMEIAHGRNKTDAQAQTTPFFDLRSDFDDRRNDVHNRSRYAFVLTAGRRDVGCCEQAKTTLCEPLQSA